LETLRMLRDRPLNLNLPKMSSKLLLKLSQLLTILLEKPCKKILAVVDPRRAQAKRSVELVQAALAGREVLILAVKEMRVKLPMILNLTLRLRKLPKSHALANLPMVLTKETCSSR
jgi:hypothetical protein